VTPPLRRLGLGLLCFGVVACSGAATAREGAGQAPGTSQTQPAPRPAAATAFDGQRAWQHLEQIVAHGPRPSGSAAIRQTRAYITRTLASYGLGIQDQRFTAQTPAGPIEMENLVIRLPGRRNERILITGHYDTKRMPNARFVGASDGGSSAAWLIEAARVLALNQTREFTYEIIWFDGEEATCTGWSECGTALAPDNTYGSRHYVSAAKAAKAMPLMKAMILVDMIGDRDLELRRDSNSTPWLVDILWSTARRLSYGHIFTNTVTSVEDDHTPFLAAGIPSVDLIDLDTYPYWHTPDDTIDKLSAQSLQAVGDVVISAIPEIERRLAAPQP
jgi:hypothetical protein